MECIKEESKELFRILLVPAAHGVKPALGPECSVKAAGDKRVPPRVRLLAILDGLSTFRNLARVRGLELAEEGNHRVRQGCALAVLLCSAAHDRPISNVLAEFCKQLPEGWAVNQHLQDNVCKAHVTGVD